MTVIYHGHTCLVKVQTDAGGLLFRNEKYVLLFPKIDLHVHFNEFGTDPVISLGDGATGASAFRDLTKEERKEVKGILFQLKLKNL